MLNNNAKDLKNLLGRWDSIAINVGIVIGVGIFRVPSEVARYLSSPALIILAWFLGGVICLLGALSYSELASSHPETGGNYIYLRKSFGRVIAFLFGWTEVLVIRPGSIAAVAFIFAEYLRSFLVSDLPIKFTAISLVFTLSFINILGLKQGKRIQNLSTLAKILTLVGIILFGLFSKKGNISNFYPVEFSQGNGAFSSFAPLESPSFLTGFALALIPILWTYGGWHESTFVSGETKDSRHSLSFSLITGTLTVTLIYIAINSVYIYLVPLKEMAQAELIASNVMQILWGDTGKKILEFLVLISSLGCINGMILTGGRITHCFAKDNPVFGYLGETNKRYSTPSRSILINAVWVAVLIIWGTFNKLLFFTGIVVWLFFALVVTGIFVLRYKFPYIERPFKVPGYPIVPVIFILICIALFINTLCFNPWESLIGLSLTLSGIPVFIFLQRKEGHKDERMKV